MLKNHKQKSYENKEQHAIQWRSIKMCRYYSVCIYDTSNFYLSNFHSTIFCSEWVWYYYLLSWILMHITKVEMLQLQQYQVFKCSIHKTAPQKNMGFQQRCWYLTPPKPYQGGPAKSQQQWLNGGPKVNCAKVGEKLEKNWRKGPYMGVEPKIWGFHPKMDGENHGNPY